MSERKPTKTINLLEFGQSPEELLVWVQLRHPVFLRLESGSEAHVYNQEKRCQQQLGTRPQRD